MVGNPLLAYDSKLGAMVALLLMKKIMKREVSLEALMKGKAWMWALLEDGGALGELGVGLAQAMRALVEL